MDDAKPKTQGYKGDVWYVPDPPPLGARVQLVRDVERYPHFIAEAGSTGTVVSVFSDRFDVYAVRLDEVLPGAEEWSNEVHWASDFDESPLGDIEEIVVEGRAVTEDDAVAAGSREVLVHLNITLGPDDARTPDKVADDAVLAVQVGVEGTPEYAFGQVVCSLVDEV